MDQDSEAELIQSNGPTGIGSWAIFNPHKALHRYFVLIFISLLGFGSYFCYDNPGALETHIQQDMSVTTSQFTSLYALYSWPNVIMCFFGGVLIDQVLGIRLSAILFMALLLTGQFIFASGALFHQFWMMQVGRFIFGLGGESLAVAQNTYTVGWFKGRELNMVFGFQISVSRGGSTLNFNTMQRVYNHLAQNYDSKNVLGYTLMIAGLTCVLSFVCSMVVAFLDKRASRILEREEVKTGEKIKFTDVKDFKTEFWLLTIICLCFYVTIFPFIALASEFFVQKWGFSPNEANTANSLVYVISAITSPFIGLMVDMVGRNLIFLLIACLLVMFSHMALAVTFINLWVPMIFLGLGYSILCSALWPLVAFVVPQRQLGTAYGVMQAIQNLGLAVLSNVAGILVDWKGYILLELFFVLWVAVSVIFSIVLIVLDNLNGGELNRSAADRRKMSVKRLTEDGDRADNQDNNAIAT